MRNVIAFTFGAFIHVGWAVVASVAMGVRAGLVTCGRELASRCE